MRIRSCLFGAFLLGGGFAGCDCGETPTEGRDASPPIYDAGPIDGAALDAVGTDLSGQDVLGVDATQADAAGSDATRIDAAGADATVTDAAGNDSAGADAAGTDAAGTDAALPDASHDDLASIDAAAPLRPTADAGGPYSLLPGELVVLQGGAEDLNPGDLLSYLWQPVGGPLPAGVTLSDEDTLTPTITITRSTYEGGPEDLALQLQLTVTDSTALTGTSTATVTILDERGPHVDNTATYEGVGYLESGSRHGYCGVQAHPCASMEDALTNLADALDDGASYDPWLLVATTGTAYDRGAALLLDGGLGVVCGYDPVSWTRATGVSRTPIHFSGQNGVHIDSAGVLLEGCEVVGSGSGSTWANRAAVLVDGVVATVRDNLLVANNDDGNAVGLLIDAQATGDRCLVSGNDITGGDASTTAFGLEVRGGVPDIAGNTILGGVAPDVAGLVLLVATGGAGQRATVSGNTVEGGDATNSATGINVWAGDPSITDNLDVVGGTASTLNIGIAVSEEASGPVISGNTSVGVETASGAAIAVGAFLVSGADLSGNTLRGGLGAYTAGLVADANPDDIVDPNDPNSPMVGDFAFTSSGDTLEGGSGTFTVALSVANGARGTVTAAAATGADSGSSPLNAVGAAIDLGSSLILAGGSISSGDAIMSAAGARAEAGAVSLTVQGSEIIGGDTSLGDSSSFGIFVEEALLNISASNTGALPLISAGDADSISDGIALACRGSSPGLAGHSISDATITAGRVRASNDSTVRSSTGVYVNRCGLLTLSDSTITAGQADRGVSYGMFASGTQVHSTSDSFTAGDALGGLGHSTGIRVQNGALLADGIAAYGASGTNSHGIWLYDAPSSTVIHGIAAGGAARTERSNGVRVTASLGSRIDSVALDDLVISAARAVQESFGVYFGNPSSDCRLTGLTASGGVAPQSAGAFFTGGAGQPHLGLRIVAGTYTGGDPVPSSGSVTPPVTVGVMFVRACDGCTIAQITAGGGAIPGTIGVSAGARFNTPVPLSANTQIYSNAFFAGDAPDARGVQLDGDAGDTLRLLNNTIDGGGRSAGESFGVKLGWAQGSTGAHTSGVIVGNIIGAGLGGTSHNIYEDCTGSGTNKISAEPFQPVGGRNNNLWPAGTALLYDIDAGGGGCAEASVTDIGAINLIAPYTGDTASDDKTWSEDPSFDSDGLHLLGGSSMLAVSHDTIDWFLADSPMLDIDGDARPSPVATVHDIGCDEL